MGADAVLDTSREDALDELRKITGNKLLGVVDTGYSCYLQVVGMRSLKQDGMWSLDFTAETSRCRCPGCLKKL